MDQIKFESVDQYIHSFSGRTRDLLNELRSVIKEAAPTAQEKISYNMPTYFLKKNLIHFAGYKNHIGIYPTPSAIIAFEDRLSGYKISKGAIQLPLDRALPVELITEMVLFRVREVTS